MAEAQVASTREGTDVVLEVHIEASQETIFPYLTDPEKMVAWMGTSAELEPSPGGKYRVAVTDEHIALGDVVEVDPPNRLVFTWGWEGNDTVPPGSSKVEVTLTPSGDGTLVRLAHSGLPDEQQCTEHARGWSHYLERLEKAASGGDPGPDPWAQPPATS